jgi:hypothetical protein
MPYDQLVGPLDWDWVPSSLLVDHAIVPHTRRFQTLSVILSVDAFKALADLPPGSWDNLEVLFLRIHDKAESIVQHSSPSFKSAARLRELGIDVTSGCHLSVHFPWANLTRLYINGSLDADIHLTTLTHCPLLTDLILTTIYTIDADMESRMAQIPNLPLQLKYLTSMHLRFSCSNPFPFLSSLHLPSLKSVRTIHPESLDWSSPALLTFLLPMKLNLQHFETIFTSGPLAPMDEVVFSHLTNIRVLKISQNYFIRSSGLERIGSGEFLPSLQQMEFGALDFMPVVDMLHTRLNNSESSTEVSQPKVQVIENVRVRCLWLSLGLQEEEAVVELRSKGINLEVFEIDFVL